MSFRPLGYPTLRFCFSQRVGLSALRPSNPSVYSDRHTEPRMQLPRPQMRNSHHPSLPPPRNPPNPTIRASMAAPKAPARCGCRSSNPGTASRRTVASAASDRVHSQFRKPAPSISVPIRTLVRRQPESPLTPPVPGSSPPRRALRMVVARSRDINLRIHAPRNRARHARAR